MVTARTQATVAASPDRVGSRVCPPPVARAGISCRVSTPRQEEDGTSLDTQQAACHAHCAERGHAVAAVFREVFTGAKYRERPDLGTARRMLRDGEADVLVS